MKGGLRVAAAVGAGYLLGRTRKMRLALMLAATGSLSGARGGLLTQGKNLLGSSPELVSIAETVRGELVGAARAAAITAATSRINAFNEKLQERAKGSGPSDRSAAADEELDEDTESDETETDTSDTKGEDEAAEPVEESDTEGEDEAAEPVEESDTEGEDEAAEPVEESDTEGEDEAAEPVEEEDSEPERPATPRRRTAGQVRAGSRRPRRSGGKADDDEETTPRRRSSKASGDGSTSRAPIRRSKR
jgi:hypothetical protein